MKNIKFGFTLVEIFIIVIIIGLLSAIAIPSYFKAKETSAKRFAENELKKQAASRIVLEKPEPGEKPEPEMVTATNSLTEKELVERYEARKRERENLARIAQEEKMLANKLTQEKKRVAHRVEKMFEVDGVAFYSATTYNNFFIFAISTNGIVTISK
jgi:Tfp pilus assembly protein PilE